EVRVARTGRRPALDVESDPLPDRRHRLQQGVLLRLCPRRAVRQDHRLDPGTVADRGECTELVEHRTLGLEVREAQTELGLGSARDDVRPTAAGDGADVAQRAAVVGQETTY